MNYLAYTVRFLVILLWTALPALAHAAPDQPAVLVVGDSLSAAYGIPQKAGWVSLLQKRLADQRYPHQVINASISGETTSGGLARLSRVLDSAQPSVVIIELGGNDGLRGLPLASVRSNLAAMIERSLARDAQVLLVGMRLPPNYGPAYVKRFHQI
ncbi:MAG TPA: arylesterase, partial [Gammaproteobacteria bacterium]|nr:arylesterase [Gammaproteobacteria bacterium]